MGPTGRPKGERELRGGRFGRAPDGEKRFRVVCRVAGTGFQGGTQPAVGASTSWFCSRPDMENERGGGLARAGSFFVFMGTNGFEGGACKSRILAAGRGPTTMVAILARAAWAKAHPRSGKRDGVGRFFEWGLSSAGQHGQTYDYGVFVPRGGRSRKRGGRQSTISGGGGVETKKPPVRKRSEGEGRGPIPRVSNRRNVRPGNKSSTPIPVFSRAGPRHG